MQEYAIDRVLMTDGGHRRYVLWKPYAAKGFTQECTWEDAVNVETDTDTDGEEPSVTVGSQFTQGQRVRYTKTGSQVTIARVQSDLLGGGFYDIDLPDESQRQTVAEFLQAAPVPPPKPPGGYSPPREREVTTPAPAGGRLPRPVDGRRGVSAWNGDTRSRLAAPYQRGPDAGERAQRDANKQHLLTKFRSYPAYRRASTGKAETTGPGVAASDTWYRWTCRAS